MEISYEYTKARSSFGRQALFCERGPEVCDSVAASAPLQRLFVLRNPVHQPAQFAPRQAQHCVNTSRVDYTSSGANHAEGGWPRDVSAADPEATQRHRRKVEKDEGYLHCVASASPEMEHYVLQNNAISMYDTYYTELRAQPALEQHGMRAVNVFRDPAGGRPVAAVAWDPERAHRFAACHVAADYSRTTRASLDCFIWDLENPNEPLLKIDPPCQLLDIQYNPRDPNTMAGGLMTGQVAVWDCRKGGKPVSTCPPYTAHRDLVRKVLFIASKSGQEFFSAGPDGACKWWDCRKLNDFTDEMIVDVVKSSNDTPSMATSNGVSVLEYEPTVPTRFMVGTENGYVIAANRKGKTAMDQFPAKFEAHLGPVWALKRNPGFLKNFLTVGDWTARVWSEECRDSPVLWTPPARHKVTDGAWSPVKFSVMILTYWDGLVSVWDLLRRQHAPVLTMRVCADPLLSVSAHDAGALVALGSRAGSVHLAELSHSLTVAGEYDKLLMTSMLEREARRERVLEVRAREVRLRQRQAAGSPALSDAEADAPADEAAAAAADAAAASDYAAEVKRALAAL